MPDPPPWKASQAKSLLRGDILSGVVLSDMAAKDVFNSRPEYQAYAYRNFATNLKNLRGAIASDHARMVEDAACYEHDLAIVHNQGFRSEPDYLPWHRSPAATLLAHDVAEGKNKTMPPRDLRATRPEYEPFPLKQFRQFVQQEVGKAAKKEARFLKKQQKQQKDL